MSLVTTEIAAADAQQAIDKMVPEDSPLSEQVRSFIFNLVALSPNYLLNIQNFNSLTNPTILSDVNCQTIISLVKSNKQSDAWAVSYMLAQFINHYRSNPYTDKPWQFMSRYLQLMILIAQGDNRHYNKVNKLGVRIRMALGENSSQAVILESLFEIHAKSNQAHQNLTDIEAYEQYIFHNEKTGKTKVTNLSKKIGEIRLAYEVVIKNKAFIERSRNSNQRDKKPKNSRNEQQLPYTTEPTRQILFANQHPEDNIADPENIADDNPIVLLDNNYKPNKKIAKSSQLQQYQVKTNYLHSRRNAFAFPSNLRVLSLLSYQRLFAKLWHQLVEENFRERQAVAVLLLSLLSGRKIKIVIAELASSRARRQWLVEESEGVTVIKNNINVTLNQRGKLKKYTRSHGSNFVLPLPYEIQAVIHNKFEVEIKVVDELLKSLKRQLTLPVLSSQHIESALSFIITHVIGERLHADMITGVDVQHSSPLYYTSIETFSLIKTYQATLNVISAKTFRSLRRSYFNKRVGINTLSTDLNPMSRELWQAHKYSFFLQLPILVSNTNKPYIGSEMALTDEACHKFFKKLADNVQSYNGRLVRNACEDIDTYIDQFNAYSLWLWHVIQIQTGIRPVNDAPGFLNQFNFDQGLYWVSDKAIRQGKDPGRLIPISNFLAVALTNYLDYLEQFASIHNPIYPKHPLAVKDILQSEIPLLQVFSFNPKGFISIYPSRIRSLLGKFLYHQDNWLRHQVRSMLTSKASEVQICALFGHEHPDQEIFHPMSSASINRYKEELAKHLDNIANELSLTQVKVKLYD